MASAHDDGSGCHQNRTGDGTLQALADCQIDSNPSGNKCGTAPDHAIDSLGLIREICSRWMVVPPTAAVVYTPGWARVLSTYDDSHLTEIILDTAAQPSRDVFCIVDALYTTSSKYTATPSPQFSLGGCLAFSSNPTFTTHFCECVVCWKSFLSPGFYIDLLCHISTSTRVVIPQTFRLFALQKASPIVQTPHATSKLGYDRGFFYSDRGNFPTADGCVPARIFSVHECIRPPATSNQEISEDITWKFLSHRFDGKQKKINRSP